MINHSLSSIQPVNKMINHPLSSIIADRIKSYFAEINLKNIKNPLISRHPLEL